MDPIRETELLMTRRQLFGKTAFGVGTLALSSLLRADIPSLGFMPSQQQTRRLGGMPGLPHFAPKAKRVIYLSMNGGPSQMDLWDHKPQLLEKYNEDLPDQIRNGQRITTMTSGQARFPVAPSKYKFTKYENNEEGIWVSELLPKTAQVVKELCVIRSMFTEAINHDPAVTFIQTGSQLPGRPSVGAWFSYGLGSMNEDLPAYVVLHSNWSSKRDAQALYSRLWGAGFLPSENQGVELRAKGDPVLYLLNPDGVNSTMRREMLDGLSKLNQIQVEQFGDPEIAARIKQYEMAYRLQTSVPELTDFSKEPDSTYELYGQDARQAGTFAANCLLARRLVERDVMFVQIFHRGWDTHDNTARDLPLQCNDIDQACYGLITDLRQRGLLDETLIVWGGEFGRTVYCQGPLSKDDYGRDHHPRCFTMWMAGGGAKPGIVYGQTDDYSYNIVDADGNPISPTMDEFTPGAVHVHDLNATIMHLMGIDHQKLGFRYQGRDFHLTDVHGHVVHDIVK